MCAGALECVGVRGCACVCVVVREYAWMCVGVWVCVGVCRCTCECA